MVHFPFIRIAVNLSLILALMIQPMVVYAIESRCAMKSVCLAKFTTSFRCAGCDCCEVERSGDRCCCCGGVEDPEANSGCCTHPEVSPPATYDSGELTVVRPEYPDCDPTRASLTVSTVEPLAIATVEKNHEVRAVCLCQQGSLPLGDSTPKRPTSNNRDQISIGSAYANVPDTDRLADRNRVCFDAIAAPVLHFSQVMLCIWRL